MISQKLVNKTIKRLNNYGMVGGYFSGMKKNNNNNNLSSSQPY